MIREETKNILKEHGIRLSKRQGQPHVVDENVLKKMVDYGSLSSTDEVLEIGPGVGNLTSFLIENAGKVVAVERDKQLVEILRDRLGNKSNLNIIHGDVLEVKLPKFDKVVANLPYSISSPLTFRLLERKFGLAVLMYQKEFARRMVASPGSSEYSRLSVNVSYRAQAELLDEVPPGAFIPKPEVWSAIVRLKTRKPSFEVRNEDVFIRTVRAVFQHRRQKIRNSLFHSFDEVFPEANLSDDQKRAFVDDAISEKLANLRATNISPEEFGEIANSLDKEIS